MHLPHTIRPGGGFNEALMGNTIFTYGMGWFIEPYRGYTLVHHGGNVEGASLIIGSVPQEKIGRETNICLLTNNDGEIDSVSIPIEPEVENVVFKRKPVELPDDVRNALLGEYLLPYGGLTITITRLGGKFYATQTGGKRPGDQTLLAGRNDCRVTG